MKTALAPMVGILMSATLCAEIIADFKKLDAPDTRMEEIARLMEVDRPSEIKSYLWLKASQRGDQPALRVLCANYGLGSSDFTGFADYKVENPEELFPKVDKHIFGRTKPSMDPVRDSVVMVFDPKGQEIMPFGGDNYINRGYCADFNGDGILDRADSTHYGVNGAEDHHIQVFELKTFESKPRTLLEVIFNWHPDEAADENNWDFSCEDTDGDGFVEITFGPSLPVDDPRCKPVVFRWDVAANKYVCPPLPEKAHVRILSKGASLKAIAKAGGLGYPLIGKSESNESEPRATASKQKPYVFESLKGQSDVELAEFFRGKDRRDSFGGGEDSFPSIIPEDLWAQPAKEAALALANANRTQSHRKRWQLAVDDRGGLSPPKSGWFVYNLRSDASYSYSASCYVLRYGMADPSLTVYETNSIGVVGRNPWADHAAHQVRVIALSAKEARFIAELTFWLDRIRSRDLLRDDSYSLGTHWSSADGFGTLSIHPDDGNPRKLANDTLWAGSSISGRWTAQYDPCVCLNLVDLFLRDSLTEQLGARWKLDQEIDRQSLVTSTEDRLEARVGTDQRHHLLQSYRGLLKHHAKDPMPPSALRQLVHAAGEEALVDLLADLKAILVALEHDAEKEKEYQSLKQRFGDSMPDITVEGNEERWTRYQALIQEREFDAGVILHGPLKRTIRRLELASQEAELMTVAVAGREDASWAMTQLHRRSPRIWADIIESQFDGAVLESRRSILRTLCAGAPETAKALIASLPQEVRFNLIIEIADFHMKQKSPALAEDLPLLMNLVRDRSKVFHRRGSAMELLANAELSVEMNAELTQLLVAEIQKPHKDDSGHFDTLDEAVRALMKLPHAERHLDLIRNHPELQRRSFETGFRAIGQMTVGREDRQQLLSDFLRPRFKTSSGFMNGMFCMILAHDLRLLAPELAKYASEGPQVNDGDGADYSGGSFESPVGQRYHLAREITALWSEPDPLTRSRMWVFMALAHPYEFDSDHSSEALRTMAGEHIRQLPKKLRVATLNAAQELMPVPEHYDELHTWLAALKAQ